MAETTKLLSAVADTTTDLLVRNVARLALAPRARRTPWRWPLRCCARPPGGRTARPGTLSARLRWMAC